MKAYQCSWCGKIVYRWPSNVGKHVFCCSSCRSAFLSKKTNPDGYIKHPHLTEYNKSNNAYRMDFITREKLRTARLGKGKGLTYTKLFGVLEHRIVAEQKLGRPLKTGEVVHHINENKRDNRPENLMVFKSQAEHAAWHSGHREGR